MMLKQKQQQQQKASALPMLEMMSLLNAKSSAAVGALEPEKLSSLMMSSMMAAAMNSAANASSSTSSSGTSSSANVQNGDDYCCILCGYKEQSVERLKDHINLHFIGQVKRKHEESTKENNGAESNAKRPKIKEENINTDQPSAPLSAKSESRSHSPQGSLSDTESPNNATASQGTNQLKCNSCDIGFSHLSNFVAHKKYYCRGMQATLRNISTASKEGSNGSESPSK